MNQSMKLLSFSDNIKEKNEGTNLYTAKHSFKKRWGKMNLKQMKNTVERKRNIREFDVEDHATKRWNERIGPIVEHHELKDHLSRLFLEPDRFLFLNHEFGLIDNDILFTYFVHKKRITMTTFYGRISDRPYLLDLNTIRTWNKHSKDKINLSLSQSELNQQTLPPLAGQTVFFNDHNREYKLETYYDSFGKKHSFLLFLEGNEQICFKEYSEEDTLPKFAYKALKMMKKSQKKEA